MFFKPKDEPKESVFSGNKNKEIVSYFKKLKNPCTNRKKDRYYIEMQMLSFQLLRYLRMNNDPNEHAFQGNWNWTYFKENVTEEDWQLLVNRILGGMNKPQWLNAVEYWKNNREDKQEFLNLIEDDIGDTFVRVIYKPKGHDEIKRIVKKIDLKNAISEINERIEIDYLKTEVVEYK